MKRPILWSLLGLIAGILVSRFFVFSNLNLFLGLALSLLFLCVSSIFRKAMVLGFSIFCLFALLGNWISNRALEEVEQKSNLQNFAQEGKVYWVGKVLEPCQQGERDAKLIVEVWEVKVGKEVLPAQGKLLLGIGGTEACVFSAGDIIQSFSKLKVPNFYHNQYSFDYPFYLKIRGITLSSFVESKEQGVKRAEEATAFQKLFENFRRKAVAQIDLLQGEEAKQLLKTLFLGNSYKLSESLQKIFRKSGSTHLLVVSGLHLAMVMAFLYFLFRGLLSLYPPLLLKISVRHWSYWLALPCVIFYSLLVGFSPSVLRSLLSLVVLSLLLLYRRRQDPLSLLFLVAFSILFIFPLCLFDLSFQLSFLSIFFILLLLPPFQKYFETKFPRLLQKRILWSCLQIFMASLVVQIGLFPLLVNTFYQVSWVSLPANLFLVPYFSFILMPLGMLGLLFSWMQSEWAPFFFQMAADCMSLVLGFLKWLTSPAWVTSWIPRMSAIQIILYFSLILIFLIPWERRKKVLVFSLLFFLNLLAWIYPRWEDAQNPNLRLSFLDVGQGDSILIEFPQGKKMLIDSGGLMGTSFDIGEKVLLPTLLGRGITHLDYLVLTHPHPDHFGGMRALLEAYTPQEFWWNGEKVETEDLKNLFQALAEKQIPMMKKDSGSGEVLINGVKIHFLHPKPDVFFPDHPDAATLNNHSLVMHLEDRGFSVLLSGDIQKEAEEELWNQKKLDSVDLLKVPHHGSNTSSSEKLIEQVKPCHAVIQLGRNNRFGFPRPEVLERYQKIGTKIYRTDQQGEIDFDWDGSSLKVETLIPSLVAANPAGLCR